MREFNNTLFLRLNRVLVPIREHLQEGDDGVTAYGPAGADSSDAARDAEAGEGGAINPSDVSATLDQYLTGIGDLVVLEYGKTDNEALNFVFSSASKLARDGLVPTMPDDDAAPDEVAMWLGKAKSCGFAGQVLSRAREMLKK